MAESRLIESHNKKKILNDPVYGFISIHNALIYDLIEHPYFQRLRRIKQVGMSHLVYPGANHTRFHHALGAMHLMQLSVTSLREKGVEITPDEETGALIAILLHDIGHGPFSHSLEFTLSKSVSHEVISALFMEKLNEEFNGALTTGISIFRGTYPKRFLHQLVSSELDMDRLDYLSRDSFYTGVSEGVVSNQRIIKMLNVAGDELVVDEKGIYSIEKFIVARRLMYWQVYLHKTVVSAERLLISILRRAQYLALQNEELFCSPALRFFLYKEIRKEDFTNNPEVLETFAELDDFDIMGAIKVWKNHADPILSDLCKRITTRKLSSVVLSNEPFRDEVVELYRQKAMRALGLREDEIDYYVQVDTLENHAYNRSSGGIKLLKKNGSIIDLAEASDNQALVAQTETVLKHVLYIPKEAR
jgi:HD superfamily phosphohydrolase